MSDKCECVGRCADKPETMTDIINDILGLAVENRRIITDMSNSFRRGSVEPLEDGKVPDLDKFDKMPLSEIFYARTIVSHVI